MRKLLIILLFVPVFAFSKEPVYWYYHYNGTDWNKISSKIPLGQYVRQPVQKIFTSDFIDDIGIIHEPDTVNITKYQLYSTTYTWNTANTNINLTQNSFGTPLATNDSVIIPNKTGGYRSFAPTKIGLNAGGVYIHVYWPAGSYITPSNSSLAAQNWDSCYNLDVNGWKMNDHVDQAVKFVNNYSGWLLFQNCSWQGGSGFGPGDNLTQPDFNGDSTKTFHHIKFLTCLLDSMKDLSGGNAWAIAFGGDGSGVNIRTNNYWRDIEIGNGCSFSFYASNTGPSNFIRITQTLNVDVHDITLHDLGIVLHPTGHTSAISIWAAKYRIWNVHFGPNIFGNDIRSLGQMDKPDWGAAYTGQSEIWNCISEHKRKYPFFETRNLSGTDITNLPYDRARCAPFVDNISCYSMANGVGNSTYLTAIVDCYANDSIFLHNSYAAVVNDTGFVYIFTVSKSNGAVTYIDTINNRLNSSFANSGLADTTLFDPIQNGSLYISSMTFRGWQLSDFYSNPLTKYIGAVQYVNPVGNRLRKNKRLRLK